MGLFKKIQNFFLDIRTQYVITALLLLQILFIQFMPYNYVEFFNHFAVRIVIAVIVCILVFINPCYGITLTATFVVILNEYNRRNKHDNKNMENFMDLNDISSANNISEEADTVIKPEPSDINELINDHNMQVTSLNGIPKSPPISINKNNNNGNVVDITEGDIQYNDVKYNTISVGGEMSKEFIDELHRSVTMNFDKL